MIIQTYVDNPIYILPQTVYYRGMENLLRDAELFGRHPRLTIVARDHVSYEHLKTHFSSNTIILAPDMAFCIPPEQLAPYAHPVIPGSALFLKRSDHECRQTDYAALIGAEQYDTRDWPPLEAVGSSERILNALCRLSRSRPLRFLMPATDAYAARYFKNDMVKQGVEFLSRYETIYTTRLHVAILCCLLGKPFTLFDNTYGKNKHFFDTWLSDVDGAVFKDMPD